MQSMPAEYVHTDGQNVLVDSVTDRKSLQDMITAFNKWSDELGIINSTHHAAGHRGSWIARSFFVSR